MAIPVEIGAAPLEEAFNDELFRVLQDALDFSTSACQFDIDQEGQLACEQYDKSILYIDEILGKLPSHTPQYSKLMQLRFNYDDRMELLKNLDNARQESTISKAKGNDKKRLNPRSFEEDERLLNVAHLASGNHLFEELSHSTTDGPFWRLRQIQKSIANGSFLSPNVFIPAGVWTQKGVKLCGISIKTSAFQEILSIIKEVDYTTADHEQYLPTPTQVLQSLLSSLRIAYEEMAAIQNQLSKPFLFIQEIVPDDTTKSAAKGQVALSRFTSIVATFGKSVINFAEVGYQRLGTMATKISEEDFATYTALLSHTCESCQVFDRIRIFVDDESDKLTKNSEHVEVCDDSALLATAAKEFDDVPADPDPDPDSNTTSSSSAGDASAIADTGIGSGHEESLSPVPDNSVTVPDDDKEQEPKDIFHPAAFYDVMQEDSRHPSEADLESWIILQDLSLVLSNISNFMKDVVCEMILRDTETLTLRHVLKTRKVELMWVAISLIVFAGVQAVHHIQQIRLDNRNKQMSRLEQKADLYGRLWGRMLISRQMFIDFTAMEGFQYPEDFVLLVEAIDADPQSQLAVRYRTLMKEVLGPIQHECLELIMDKKCLFAADGELSEFLVEYMLMSSGYKIIFTRWETGDYSIHFSQRRFPPELIDNLQIEFIKTKAELDSMVVAIKKKPKEIPRNKFFKPPPKKLDDKKRKTYYIPNSKAVSSAKSNSF